MLCSEFKFRTSEYLDRRLAEEEREAFSEHLGGCPMCRLYLDEMQRVVDLLRGASAPPVPEDLYERTLRALDRTLEPRLTIMALPPRRRLKPSAGSPFALLRRIVVEYEFNIIAYSVGLVMTVFLFAGTIMGLQPLWQLARQMQADEETIWISGAEARVMGMTSEGGYRTVSYTLPRVAEKGSLPQFAASDEVPGSDDIVVLAEVRPDGRASIVEVLSGPSDPSVVASLQTALDRPAFIPASADSGLGKPVASRVVLLLQRVAVLG